MLVMSRARSRVIHVHTCPFQLGSHGHAQSVRGGCGMLDCHLAWCPYAVLGFDTAEFASIMQSGGLL